MIEQVDRKVLALAVLMSKNIGELGTDVRCYLALYRANIWTIGDLVETCLKGKLRDVYMIGEKKEREIMRLLEDYLEDHLKQMEERE